MINLTIVLLFFVIYISGCSTSEYIKQNINDKFIFIDSSSSFDYNVLLFENKDKIYFFLSDQKPYNIKIDSVFPLKIGNSYFLKTKETISEFPNNKKGLFKLFPDKKQILEDFVKENKIDFDEVSDQIKIIDYLATH